MQRLNTDYFYKLGWQVHQLGEISPQSRWRDTFWKLSRVKNILESFVSEQILPAPLSKQAAYNVVQAIDQVMPPEQLSPEEMEAGIGTSIIEAHERLRQFEAVLAAELQQLETFVTAQKGIFDTKSLVENAENMFSNDVRSWLSEQAVTDIRQAGRCLAFELSTAAGFHLSRAVEDAIRKYYQEIAGKPYALKKQHPTWGDYIAALKNKKADEKVLNALDQMRDLHRNPISHPDVNLETDEAMMLVGLVQSAIVAMASSPVKMSALPAVRVESAHERPRDANGVREDGEETSPVAAKLEENDGET